MKVKNIVTAVLAMAMSVMACMSVAACKKDETENMPPVGTVTETDPHYYKDGLHRISVNDSGKKFVNDGVSEYRVICEKDSLSTALLISKHVKESSGATLETQTNNGLTWSSNKKWIVLGCEDLFTQAGLTMPEEDLGWSGFHIVTKGDTVFIMAQMPYGLSNGVYRFLYYTIGFETFSEDCTVYDYKKTVPLYNFDITDKSDIDLTVPLNQLDTDTTHEMGILTTSDVFIPTDGTFWHNTFIYLPPKQYFETHRDWYSRGIMWEDYANPGQPAQLCYTANGNPEEYNLMQETFMAKLIDFIEQYKTRTTITITIQDNRNFCRCDTCTASYEKYGTDAAVVIKFVNDISVKLDAYLTEQAEKNGTAKREINLLFFAYRKTINAPTKEVNGKYVAIDDSVVCRDNVGVYIAPIEAVYTKSFYDEVNEGTAENIKKWSACSNKIYMWCYGTNFDNYLYPYNNFGAMAEMYRYCVQNKAIFMYNQGQWNQTQSTAFANLKEYLNVNLAWNVNLSAAELTDRFFANYFGPAAPAMRLYFNKLQSYLELIGSVYSLELPGTCYEPINSSSLWTKIQLEGYLAEIDKAYESLSSLKESNAALYEMYYNHINLESIFPRYALIELFSSSYTAETLMQMKTSFLKDAKELGITHTRESLTLEQATENW